MYVYNLTSLVAGSIVDQWLDWRREQLIPVVIGCGLITQERLYRLLGQDEGQGQTFVWQLFTETEKQMEEFLALVEPLINEKTAQRWKEQVLGFATKMALVN